MRTSKPPKSLPFIEYFRIPHNTLYLPLKLCTRYCLQMLLGKCSTFFWGGGKQCIMGYSKIENRENEIPSFLSYLKVIGIAQSRELPLCGQVLYRLSTHGFLQLQTWTSQRKSVDSTEESTLRLVKLHSLKVIC